MMKSFDEEKRMQNKERVEVTNDDMAEEELYKPD